MRWPRWSTRMRPSSAPSCSAQCCAARRVSRRRILHFRRAVELQESAERSRVFLLELLGPLDAQQRHEQKRQQRRAQTIEGGTHVTVELAADPNEPAFDQTWESQQHTDTGNR